jgi:Protein of unknown function (DUF3987)
MMSDHGTTALGEVINNAKEILPEPPRPLMRPVAAADPFPVDALGDILGRAARAIHDRIQAPMAIAGNSVLATGALAVQGHADVQLPIVGQVRPLSCFFVTVAESGERKTASDQEASWPIREREATLREKRASEQLVYENKLAAWEKARETALRTGKGDRDASEALLGELGSRPCPPLAPLLTCPEPTIEGLCRLFRGGWPSLGIYSAEGGQFIGGHGMTPEAKLRTAAGLSEMWDSGVFRRVRADDDAIVLPGRRLSMHLMAQPKVADVMFGDPLLLNQGLLSRVLVSAPDTAAGTRQWREERSETATDLKNYDDRLVEMLGAKLPMADDRANGLKQLPRLVLSPAARERWIRYADHIELAVAPGGELDTIRGLACKLAEHAARLAGVLTLVDKGLGAMEIDDAKLDAGIALADHYAAEALRLFGISQVATNLMLAEKLRCWLLRRWDDENVSLPDIYQLSIPGIRTKAVAARIVEILEDHGWLERLPGGADIKRIRRRDAWRIIKSEA